MAHFLKSCNVFEEMLPAVYDIMYTRGIRVDERDQLFTASNIVIIKLMAELHPFFADHYLRKSDTGDSLVSTVYNNAAVFANDMEKFETQKSDAFRDKLKLDENGNLIGSTQVKSNVHTMILNHPHKLSRNTTEELRLNKG